VPEASNSHFGGSICCLAQNFCPYASIQAESTPQTVSPKGPMGIMRIAGQKHFFLAQFLAETSDFMFRLASKVKHFV